VEFLNGALKFNQPKLGFRKLLVIA